MSKEDLDKANDLCAEARKLIETGDADKRLEAKSLIEQAEELRSKHEAKEHEVELKLRLEDLESKAVESARMPFSNTVENAAPKSGQAEMKDFMSYLRGNNTKALSSIRETDGGVLVPEDMRDQMILKLRDILEIRDRSTVLQTETGVMSFPTFDNTETPDNVAEAATISVKDIGGAFGKRQFVAHKKALLVKVPRELIDDASIDVMNFLVDRLAGDMAEHMESEYIEGNGVNEPLGLLNADLPAQDIAGSAAALAIVDFQEAPFKLKKKYRRNAAFIMGRDVRELVAELQDADGRPLIEPSAVAGMPDMIRGLPVVEVESMPAHAADGDCLFLCGDLKYYWIVERKNLEVEVSRDRYFEEDQIALKITMRGDAAPVMGEAFVRYNRN